MATALVIDEPLYPFGVGVAVFLRVPGPAHRLDQGGRHLELLTPGQVSLREVVQQLGRVADFVGEEERL